MKLKEITLLDKDNNKKTFKLKLNRLNIFAIKIEISKGNEIATFYYDCGIIDIYNSRDDIEYNYDEKYIIKNMEDYEIFLKRKDSTSCELLVRN